MRIIRYDAGPRVPSGPNPYWRALVKHGYFAEDEWAAWDFDSYEEAMKEYRRLRSAASYHKVGLRLRLLETEDGWRLLAQTFDRRSVRS